MDVTKAVLFICSPLNLSLKQILQSFKSYLTHHLKLDFKWQNIKSKYFKLFFLFLNKSILLFVNIHRILTFRKPRGWNILIPGRRSSSQPWCCCSGGNPDSPQSGGPGSCCRWISPTRLNISTGEQSPRSLSWTQHLSYPEN